MDLLPAVDYDRVINQGLMFSDDHTPYSEDHTPDDTRCDRDASFPDVVVNRIGEDAPDGDSSDCDEETGRKVSMT